MGSHNAHFKCNISKEAVEQDRMIARLMVDIDLKSPDHLLWQTEILAE